MRGQIALRNAATTARNHVAVQPARPARLRLLPAAHAAPRNQPDVFEEEEEEEGTEEVALDLVNALPDYDSDAWMDTITDWDEFWSQDVWVAESEGLDDEHDARARYLKPSHRMFKLLHSLQNTDKKYQIIHFAQIANLLDHSNGFDGIRPKPDDRARLFDDLTVSDLRAISEKRKKARIAEDLKQRHQARLRNRVHMNYESDARLIDFEGQPLNSSVTDQEIQDLITLKGRNLDPRKHQAEVRNQWGQIDYANDLGVRHIEDMEEFLQRKGHWALPSMAGYLEYEVVMQKDDFVDFDDAAVAEELGEDEVLENGLPQSVLDALARGRGSGGAEGDAAGAGAEEERRGDGLG